MNLFVFLKNNTLRYDYLGMRIDTDSITPDNFHNPSAESLTHAAMAVTTYDLKFNIEVAQMHLPCLSEKNKFCYHVICSAQVKANFDMDASYFGNDLSNQQKNLVLQHERVHLEIANIVEEETNNDLSKLSLDSYTCTPNDTITLYKGLVRMTVKEWNRRLKTLQDGYDAATDNGNRRVQQEQWNKNYETFIRNSIQMMRPQRR